MQSFSLDVHYIASRYHRSYKNNVLGPRYFFFSSSILILSHLSCIYQAVELKKRTIAPKSPSCIVTEDTWHISTTLELRLRHIGIATRAGNDRAWTIARQ
jgi:hypothetical protein